MRIVCHRAVLEDCEFPLFEGAGVFQAADRAEGTGTLPVQVKECPFEARNIANSIATENPSVEPLDDLDRSLLNIRWDRFLGRDFSPDKGLRVGVGGPARGADCVDRAEHLRPRR
jgi:hypothetical protein